MTESVCHAYLFEARGIQRFLFASGRLRDMLSGSELIDSLCAPGGHLDQVLATLSLQAKPVRQAGGAFYLLLQDRSAAERLCAAWRLACARWLPGLEVIDALASATSARKAIQQGMAKLREARNALSPALPNASALARRSPRTGLAAAGKIEGEWLDAATLAQRTFHRDPATGSLTRRFLDEPGLIWPSDFSDSAHPQNAFPLGERRLVGLLHMDGNGLGEVLRQLSDGLATADDDTYVRLYHHFSSGLAQATARAAAEASRAVLLPAARQHVMPARPLVLGGDDISLLIRPDLALAFASHFLGAFETETGRLMEQLASLLRANRLNCDFLPAHLTACGGLVIMKASHPFMAGHDLAEQLCARAKRDSREAREHGASAASRVAFLKLQDSLVDDATLQTRGYVIDGTAGTNQLSSYDVTGHNIPLLQDLVALADSVGTSLNPRPLREIAALMEDAPGLAEAASQRWRALNRQALPAFDTALARLLPENRHASLPIARNDNAAWQGPLHDLLTLLSAREEAPRD